MAVRKLSFITRTTYKRELLSWTLLAVALGGVEGGITGVIIKNAFAGAVSATTLNFAVAAVAGAPALANVLSWAWAALAQGRDKVRLLVTIQALCCASLLLVATAPINGVGVAMVIAGAVLARFFWSGVTTVRSAVWRANYPREMLATMSGRLVTVGALLMGVVGIVVGATMEYEPLAFRWVYVALALVGVSGAYAYRRMRMRQQKRLLALERENRRVEGALINPFRLLRLLDDDARFREYMSLMFAFGGANLMLLAPLIVILNDHMQVGELQQVLVTSSIPLLVMPLAIPVWARLLDTRHVVHYRARQGWSSTVMMAAVLLAVVTRSEHLLWVSAALYGVAQAGGMLGWNIGHHDFAPPERATQYMSVHMTLTGVRGIMMPIAGVALYELVERFAPGYGPWTLAVPLSISFVACLGFVRASRRMRRQDAGT